MTQQQIIWTDEARRFLDYCPELQGKSFLAVGGRAARHSRIIKDLKEEGVSLMCFSEYSPNPKYEEVRAALSCFRENHCDAIIAIGGGSAIDVAKCVKAFLGSQEHFLEHPSTDTGVPLVAIPATAGTGSEATQFAVVYDLGKKYSVDYPHLRPDIVLFEPGLLSDLPLYQKKCTLMDALCQGIESYWAAGRTRDSQSIALESIHLIIHHFEAYLENRSESYPVIQKAAYLSGRAINQTRTTAPHAMSYKLTSLYGIPHGHAVALCMRQIWPYMMAHMTSSEQKELMKELSAALGAVSDDCHAFEKLYKRFSFEKNYVFYPERDLQELCDSVNPDRMKNHPVEISPPKIEAMYKEILSVPAF